MKILRAMRPEDWQRLREWADDYVARCGDGVGDSLLICEDTRFTPVTACSVTGHRALAIESYGRGPEPRSAVVIKAYDKVLYCRRWSDGTTRGIPVFGELREMGFGA